MATLNGQFFSASITKKNEDLIIEVVAINNLIM